HRQAHERVEMALLAAVEREQRFDRVEVHARKLRALRDTLMDRGRSRRLLPADLAQLAAQRDLVDAVEGKAGERLHAPAQRAEDVGEGAALLLVAPRDRRRVG